MRASNDLNKLELYELFDDLKAYKFELQKRSIEESTSNHPTKVFIVVVAEPIQQKTPKKISNDVISLFVNKFSRFIKKNHMTYQNQNQSYKKESIGNDTACFNCEKTIYCIAKCSNPKKDDQKRHKGHQRNDKKSRKDMKVMVAEESKSKLVEANSDSSNLESQSNLNDDDKVHCLIADAELETTNDEVFEFEYEEFICNNIVKSLHDMI